MKSWWVADVRVDESNTRLIALGTGAHAVRFSQAARPGRTRAPYPGSCAGGGEVR